MYYYAASSERNSSYPLCCSNGNWGCKTNAMMQQVQQQYVAENTTVAADVLSRICYGLAAVAPAIGGVLLYVLTNNNKSSRRHTAMYRTAAVTGTATATRRLQRPLGLLFSSGRCCVDCFRLLLLLPLLLPVCG